MTDGFEQIELEEPRRAVEKAGFKTVLLAPSAEKVQGMNHSDKGDKLGVDAQLENADPDNFDAVLLPGGVANADKLRMNEDARRFVIALDSRKKAIAAICHGSWLLVSAGLVKGRNLTSYYTLQDDLRNAGANWSDAETVVDGNWVSSRQPEDIPAFNTAVIKLFGQMKAKAQASGH